MDKQQIMINNDELLYQDYYQQKITDYVTTIQISNNEQYLAYGVSDQKLTLMDLKSKSQIRNPFVLNDIVRVCKFSQDSKFIYFGDYFGNLYCYNVNKFRKIFKLTILKGTIYNIFLINNQQIMIKSNNSIKTYSVNSNKLLSTHYLNQFQFVIALDLDEQNQIIITGEFDNLIVFINRYTGKKLMTQPSFHEYSIKQLILLKGKQLLSRQIILHNIDYENLQLAVIRTFATENGGIYNISFVAILIDKITVFDKSLIELQTIIGEAGLLHRDCLTQQIDSLNYLIIPYSQKIKVLKRVIDQEKKQ